MKVTVNSIHSTTDKCHNTKANAKKKPVKKIGLIFRISDLINFGSLALVWKWILVH